MNNYVLYCRYYHGIFDKDFLSSNI